MKKPIKLFFSMTIILTGLLTGCNDMYDPIIKEMDGAYAIKESDEDVMRVVQKHFPPGMKVEDALKTLHQLKEQGFIIAEYHHNQARKWPDGDFTPYISPSLHDRKRRQKGIIEFSAHKKYDSNYLIVTKTASITLLTDGEHILESSGGISITGI